MLWTHPTDRQSVTDNGLKLNVLHLGNKDHRIQTKEDTALTEKGITISLTQKHWKTKGMVQRNALKHSVAPKRISNNKAMMVMMMMMMMMVVVKSFALVLFHYWVSKNDVLSLKGCYYFCK